MGLKMNVYGGYVKNNRILESASGGIATAFAETVLKNQGVVAGVAYTSDYHDAEYIIVEDIEELYKIKGVKYFFAKKNGIYKRIKQLLDEKQKVLFIGLGCDVGGLKKFLQKDYENLYLIDLVCHGATFPSVHKQYVQYLEKKYNSKIYFLNVRHKKNNWEQPYMRVVFQNGKVFEKQFYDTEYGYMFSRLSRKCCFSCCYKGSNSVADVTLGDYWGSKKEDAFYNKKGVSLVITHTEKGESLLKSLPEVALWQSEISHAIENNPNIVCQKQKPNWDYDQFLKYYNSKGLFKSCKKLYTLYDRIRYILKKVIPNRILLKLKWRV